LKQTKLLNPIHLLKQTTSIPSIFLPTRSMWLTHQTSNTSLSCQSIFIQLIKISTFHWLLGMCRNGPLPLWVVQIFLVLGLVLTCGC
jgi:membrane glycosyltransferase